MDAIDRVIQREGGYSNDPADPGGETNFGISKRCIGPDARVLTAGLEWVAASSLKTGDQLMAFDEVPERFGKLNIRRFRVATVTDVGPVKLPSSRIVTETRTVVASNDHQWLRRWGTHRVFEWSRTESLLSPHGQWTNGAQVRIGTLMAPWSIDRSREAGYLAGVLDSEGSIGSGVEFSQKKGNALVEQALQCAEHLGLTFRECKEHRGVCSYRLIGDPIAFRHVVTVGRLGAKRLLANAARQLVNTNIASTRAKHDLVVAVEPIGETELIGLNTTTRTLIVDGYLSHNSYPDLDIAHLTHEQARDIYRRDYWDRYDLSAVARQGTDYLAEALFDFIVNSGPVAIKIFQRILGVTADGVIGPKTLTAVRSYTSRYLTNKLVCERIRFLIRIPGDRFDAGWIDRALSFFIL